MKNRWIKNRRLCTIASNFEIRGKDRILTSFSVLVKQSRATIIKSTMVRIPVQGTWRVPPCRRTVATQPVSPLRVLSANFSPFPPPTWLVQPYRRCITREGCIHAYLPDCVRVFTSLRRGRDERHNSLRQNYPTYVPLSSSFSFDFAPSFPSSLFLSPFLLFFF